MTDDTIPITGDPSSDDSLTGLLTEALRQQLLNTDDMLPAKVIDYDRQTNRATVQPIIKMIDNDMNEISRSTNSNIPVLLLGAGEFFISFHLPPGTLGWIKASDRDLSLFRQNNYEESPPNTLRAHSFEDAIFIPDIMTGYTINEEDKEAMVIQNKACTVRISLDSERIKLTAPTVLIDSPDTTITDKLTIVADTEITGKLSVSGDIQNGQVNITTHIHDTSQGPTLPPRN